MPPRAMKSFHLAHLTPPSPSSVPIPADVLARFRARLVPIAGGCMVLGRRGVYASRPRRLDRRDTVFWRDADGVWHQMRAHRLALTIELGTIPDGLLGCHRCDVKACVAAEHLYAGTDADNRADRVRAYRTRMLGRAPTLHPHRGPRMTCAEVHPS